MKRMLRTCMLALGCAALIACHATVRVDAPKPDKHECRCKAGCTCNHCTGKSQGACPCSKGEKKGHGK